MTTYTFTQLIYPGSMVYTEGLGINNSGTVVGNWAGKQNHGFIYSDGSFAQFDHPGASLGDSYTYGINNLGHIVGDYEPQGNDEQLGFIYVNGEFTDIIPPGSFITTPYAVNDSDTVVGGYSYFYGGEEGFIYNDGKYTTLNYPGSSATTLRGINNNGEIVGTYIIGGRITGSFSYFEGAFTTINFPGATDGTTGATGVNNLGEIVGTYSDDSGRHGFVDDNGVFSSFDYPGSTDTEGDAINDAGQITGVVEVGTGPYLYTGFLASPSSSPTGSPHIVPETASVLAGQTVSSVNGALTGDSDPSGGTLSITSVAYNGTSHAIPGGGSVTLDGSYGTLTLGSDGAYTYAATNGLGIVTAPDGQPITDLFGDIVTTSEGYMAQASLAVTVSLGAGGAESVTDPSGSATFTIGATTLTLNATTASTYGGIIQDGSSGNIGGTVVVAGPALLSLTGASTFTGGTTIAGGTLDLAVADTIASGVVVSGAAGTGAITFAGTTDSPAVLELDTAAQPAAGGTFATTLDDFGANDGLDLKGFTYSALDTATVTGNLLTFTDTVGGATESFTLGGTQDAAYFVHDAGSDGVLIDDNVVCFAAGTRIRVVRAALVLDVPVEHLAVDDLAVTASGARRRIRWLGYRTIDCRNHPRPHDACPIRVAAHAFGDRQPSRDLFLSQGHPVLVGADDNGMGGHLVPIMCLINGTTIRREPASAVTYWHIELDKHDIVLAEGLPAESYIDLGSRPWFAGTDGALYDPDMSLPGMPGRCRPVAVDGPIVEAERRRLAIVFAMRLGAACAWPSGDAPTFDWEINECQR